MPKLGFELVKTKDRDWWHRENGDSDDGSKVIDRKTEYPSLSISDAPEEIYEYPETGTCLVKYKMTRRVMVKSDDDEPRYEVELDILSIEPARKNGGPLERTKSAMAENYRER